MNMKLSAAGFAIQVAKGTVKTQPAFWSPVAGGALVTGSVEQVEDELCSSEVGSMGEYRESAAMAAEYETRAWPQSIAGLLYAALGNIATVGSATPYTHTITPAGSLPWATVFGAKDTARRAAADCKLGELKIEWEGNGPLKITSTWDGLAISYSTIAYVPVLDEKALAYFKGIALAATIDLNGAAYDGGGKVLSGSITINRNNVVSYHSGSLTPDNIDEGTLEIDAEIKYRVPDLLPVRLLLTGAVTGTEPAVVVPYGNFSLAFTQGADVLTLAAAKVAWKTDEPDADPKGGPAELTLTGRCYGNPALTTTVVNTHASYTT